MTTSPKIPPIVIYTKEYCPYCTRAKQFFKHKGWNYEERDLSGKPEEMLKLQQRTGWRSFPQIFIGEKFVKGYEEMVSALKNGELKIEDENGEP